VWCVRRAAVVVPAGCLVVVVLTVLELALRPRSLVMSVGLVVLVTVARLRLAKGILRDCVDVVVEEGVCVCL
jgi:hypothetical protein